MFDPKSLSYPRVEDGFILYGPEDWPPAKVRVLQNLDKAAPEQAAEDEATPSGMNINTATAEELASIKGIGDEVAAAIIAARPWGSVDELTRVSGIGKAKLAKLADHLTV